MGIEFKRIAITTHDLGWSHLLIIFSLAVILWAWKLKVSKKNGERRKLRERLMKVTNGGNRKDGDTKEG